MLALRELVTKLREIAADSKTPPKVATRIMRGVVELEIAIGELTIAAARAMRVTK